MNRRVMSGLVAAILLAGTLGGCSGAVMKTVMSVETETSTKKTMSYHLFDGEKEYSFTVGDGETVEMTVDIVTEEGSLDVDIFADGHEDDPVYQGEDIPTSTFALTIDEPGEYTIRLEADNHRGSYSFSWGK